MFLDADLLNLLFLSCNGMILMPTTFALTCGTEMYNCGHYKKYSINNNKYLNLEPANASYMLLLQVIVFYVRLVTFLRSVLCC